MAKKAGAEVISVADDGIYDAMDSGIARVKSGIIGLLNADDFYASDRVTQLVASAMIDGVDACFGDLVYVAEQGAWSREQSGARSEGGDPPPNSGPRTTDFRVVRYWKAWRGTGGPIAAQRISQAMRWGWMPPHPTFFVRKGIYERLGAFRLDHGTAADYELMLRFLSQHRIHVS